MMRTLLIIILLSGLFSPISAEQTTRKRLKPKSIQSEIIACSYDTIVPDSTKIIIAGYDKPLSSRHEAFFVTNHYDKELKVLEITFNYYDLSGRQLHSITKTINCEIPAGETRQLHIPSWDKQFSFYYYLSPRPRRQATPFIVKHTINKTLLGN